MNCYWNMALLEDGSTRTWLCHSRLPFSLTLFLSPYLSPFLSQFPPSGEIVIQPPLPMADHSSLPILQPHSAQTYSAGPQQLVSFPSTPHHHHHRHSGPITVTNDPLQVYTGKPLVPMEPYYHAATSRSKYLASGSRLVC